jgi:[FeFe] hydrogenase H-cluster maturation GTPase HydF
MSLNTTPSAERVHIGIFGRRNAGKSSIINAITGQNLAIVSDVAGTTTDPVYKAMELLPLGPVMVIDTPGLDDEGELGALRVQKAIQVLGKTDLALLVTDCTRPLDRTEERLLTEFQERKIPYLLVKNKCDLLTDLPECDENTLYVSAATGFHIFQLKERLAALVPEENPQMLVRDLLEPQDLVVLVVPIDKAAPKGRLILPQQQTIRDILEADAVSVVVKENGLGQALRDLGKKPKMVITDSQVFGPVAQETPADILLTSFSILMARYKGDLAALVRGIQGLKCLRDGDSVLISEGCTHHRQCNDIGTVKLPKALKAYTGKDLDLHFTSGTEFPEDLTPYRLIIHCGGCMLNEKEMKNRLRRAAVQGVPMTNYGIFLAEVNGILRRSLQPFPSISALLEEQL